MEVLVVVLVTIAATLVLVLAKPKRVGSWIACANNVKQIGLSYRIWAEDNANRFPMDVSVANGGAMELAAAGNVVAVFQVMSNELSNPKVLLCPFDSRRPGATNFTYLSATNISYFVGLDAGTNYSGDRLLCGDANLTIRGGPVKSGVINLASNAPVMWDTSRAGGHSAYGNISTADASVAQVKLYEFPNWLAKTGLATNRLAIP